MSETSFLKRRWKLLLNVITVAALFILIFATRHQLADTLENFHKVNLWVLLLIIPIEIWNYDAQARLYRNLFDILGDKLSYRYWYRISLEMGFVNNVFPSAGVSGMSYLGVRLRRNDIRAGRAALVQLMKLVLVFFAFEALLLFGVFMLAVFGQVNNFVILLASSLTTLLVVGTLAFTYIVGSRERINATFTFITKLMNALIEVVRPGHPETINIARMRPVFDELHENYVLFQSKWRELKAPFLFAFFANLTEVLAVYVVYVAFGHWVNIGAIILAYAVANFAGIISVLPGGVGVYEALMTGVLVAAGVPAALTIPVVVMYRVVNSIIQLPPGYYFYHRTLHSDGEHEPKATAVS
jgi:putative heme transporter